MIAISTIGLTSCQTSKNLLNGFTSGTANVAELPEYSTSRVQFVIYDGYGMFIASPNSANVKIDGKSLGVVATRFVSPLFNEEDKQKISASNLGMPKPDTNSKPVNVVERYVNPDEQIYIKYSMGNNNGTTQKNCSLNGNFTPKSNTDYRITGMSDRKSCFMVLEEFEKNKNGQTQLNTIKFD